METKHDTATQQLFNEAAAAVVKAAPPELIERLVAEQVKATMSSFMSYHFTDAIKAVLLPMFHAAIAKPSFQGRMQEAVEAAAEQILGKVTDDVKAALSEAVRTVVKQRLKADAR